MKLSRTSLVFLGLVWVLVMLYPDPAVLVRSMNNLLTASADVGAAEQLAAQMPSDPNVIERYVLSMPYENDWETYGVPWYFPTASEALAMERGDCEARAMIMTSVLTAKNIPNQLRMALNHIWVDYPGKLPNEMENPELEIGGFRQSSLFVQAPQQFDGRQVLTEQFDITWSGMPLWRLVALVIGLGAILTVNGFAAWLGRRAGRSDVEMVRHPGARRRGLIAALACVWSPRG